MANKVMKANGSAAGAYAEQNLGADHAEIWITFRVAWPVGSPSSDYFTNVTNGAAALVDRVSFVVPGWQTAWVGPTQPPNPAANIWWTVELHRKSSAPKASDLYINGTLLAGPGSPNSNNSRIVKFGNIQTPVRPGTAPGADVVYIDDVKIGTTRGASDLFADDFESGTFAAWTSTSGDVSIVDDPFPVAPDASMYVELAFDAIWKEVSPFWSNIADEVEPRLTQAITISRGRSTERDQNQPGTVTLNLRDLDGLIDPSNPSRLAFDPMTQVRVRLRDPVADTVHTLFRGFLTDLLYDLEQTGTLGHATVEASDAFEPLSKLEMIPNTGGSPYYGDAVPAISTGDIFFAETTGPDQASDRINQALDDADWPSDLRRVFTGNVQLQENIYARHDQLLTVIADAADAEFPAVANYFISKDGLVSFRGRFSRFTPETYTSASDLARETSASICFWSCGGREEAEADSAVAVIAGLSCRRSAGDLVNAVLALPKNVEETDVPSLFVKDDTAIDAYGWRSESFEDLLVLQGDAGPTTAVEECEKFAEAIVGNYKDPKTRITTLRFRGRSPDDPLAPALWELICGVELGDVIHVKTTHFGGTGGFDEDYFIEGIRYEIQPLREGDSPWPDVTLELDVSPRGFYSFDPYA